MKKPCGKKILRDAKKHEKKLFNKIAAAHVEGSSFKAWHFTVNYLNSFAAKLVAVDKAWQKLPNHLKNSKMDFRLIAKKINPFAGTDEPATLNWELKKEDFVDFRPVVAFGIENRALQYLVKRVLEAQTHVEPYQFGMKGIRRATKAVLANLNDAYCYTAEVDIRNCFPSVDVEALSAYLPIPREVIQRVISGLHLNIVSGNIYHIHGGPGYDAEDELILADQLDKVIQEGRRGLIQGSAISSLVFETLLAPALSALPMCGRCVSYADNILVMAKTENEFALMMDKLGGLLKEHPAGPLMPRIESINEPTEEFVFIGHRIFVSNSGYMAAPSNENKANFWRELFEGLTIVKDTKLDIKTRKCKAEHMKVFVRSWTSAFAASPLAEANRVDGLKLIESTVSLYLKPLEG